MSDLAFSKGLQASAVVGGDASVKWAEGARGTYTPAVFDAYGKVVVQLNPDGRLWVDLGALKAICAEIPISADNPGGAVVHHALLAAIEGRFAARRESVVVTTGEVVSP